jgi:hypothetical protein
MANQSGKTDMERIGLFSEMGYISLGDRYPKVDPKSKGFNEAAGKGKQMLPGGSKTRSGNQAGYFDSKYSRVLEGEAYQDAIKIRRKGRIDNMKKNITNTAFLPSNFTKKSSGLGNNYGTFGGGHDSFSPIKKDGKNYKAAGRNFTTIPGKKGTGFGYVNVTFQKYPDHSVEDYDRAKKLRSNDSKEHKQKSTKITPAPFKLNSHPKTFFDHNPYKMDKPLPKSKKQPEPVKKLIQKTPFKPSNPAKNIAGCKAGTFETYPKHSVDMYTGKKQLEIRSNKGIKTIFHPSPGPKSTPTRSTLDQNITKTMNKNNYKAISSIMAF